MGKLLVVFVCLAFAHVGICLNCYVCTTYNTTNICTDPFNKSGHEVEKCDDPSAVCLKEKLQSEGFRDSIHRGCFPANYCKEIGSKSKFCGTCDKDKCNSSLAVVPSVLVLVAFVLKLFL